MKNNLLILFVILTSSLFAQRTYVPDDAFEAFLIWYGYDDVLDDSVDTEHISSAVSLDIGFSSNSGTIYDLTGIEGFSSLKTLICNYNQLTSLDVSQNTELENLNCLNNQLTSLNVDGGSLILLSCQNNQLTNLDVSQNIGLTNLYCDNNPLTNLDVSQNTALQLLYCTHQQLTNLDLSNNADLRSLRCYGNQLSNLDLSHNNALYMLQCGQNLITSLDLSQNPDIEGLWCEENQLTSLYLSNHNFLYYLNCESNQLSCLNVANGNNTNMYYFNALTNPNLTCIEVDDSAWSAANWTDIDPQSSFSEDCNNECSVGINELSPSKTLIQILDMMGRETSFKPNTPLIYVYDDGSTEKVFRIE